MKLARFTHQGRTRVGAVVDDRIVDGALDPELPQDMPALLQSGKEGRRRLLELAADQAHCLPLSEVRLEAPIARPGKYLAISLNYSDHINETGFEPPEFPSFFNKQSTCVIGPGSPIHRPRVSEKLDYEGELAVVIGRRCRHVPADRAREVIGGFTVANDVSVRDWQIRSPTFTLGKSFDTHGPIGPWIVTPDEIPDPHDLRVRTWVSGDLRQDFNTGGQIFDIYHQIETLSTVCTLESGDIIATGTGSGVGVKMKPRGYMQPGDVVRIEIAQVGALENPVVEEPEDTAFID